MGQALPLGFGRLARTWRKVMMLLITSSSTIYQSLYPYDTPTDSSLLLSNQRLSTLSPILSSLVSPSPQQPLSSFNWEMSDIASFLCVHCPSLTDSIVFLRADDQSKRRDSTFLTSTFGTLASSIQTASSLAFPFTLTAWPPSKR